mgnify:FL=1
MIGRLYRAGGDALGPVEDVRAAPRTIVGFADAARGRVVSSSGRVRVGNAHAGSYTARLADRARESLAGAMSESDRAATFRSLGFFSGGTLLALFWPGHPVRKFLLGAAAGWCAASLLTKKEGTA